jgi:hypothetical protein
MLANLMFTMGLWEGNTRDIHDMGEVGISTLQGPPIQSTEIQSYNPVDSAMQDLPANSPDAGSGRMRVEIYM